MRPVPSITAIFGLLLIAVVVAGPAAAHANYVSSTPNANAILATAPTNVMVTLSESVQAGTPSIRITNSTGARFDVPPVSIAGDRVTISTGLNASGPGIYTVTWTAISAADGHFTAGSFSYAVQNADGSLPGPLPTTGPTSSGSPVSPAEVALRFTGFLGLAVAIGVAVLCLFMWLPAGRDPDVRVTRAYGLGFQVLLNAGRIGAFAFGVAMVGLWGLATSLEGASAVQGVQSSTYVQSVAIRIALAVGLFGILSRAFVHSRTKTPESTSRFLQLSLVFGGAAIIASSFGTHAAANLSLAAIGVTADAAHLLGIALWVGGLAGIVAVRTFLREDDAVPLARIVLGRFSRLAGYAVALVLVGGFVLTLILVKTWDALVGTAYGWIILGKIALFTPMVLLGAYNRYRLIPAAGASEGPNLKKLSENGIVAGLMIGVFGFLLFNGLGLGTIGGLLGAFLLLIGVGLTVGGGVIWVLMMSATADLPPPAKAVRHLAGNVRFETALGVVVLLLAGLLTTMTPTASLVAESGVFKLQVTTDGLRIEFGMQPNPSVPQIYTLTFLVWNASDGKAFIGLLNGTVRFNLTNSIDPPTFDNLDGPHLNHFFVTTPALSKAGVWQIQVRFHRIYGFDVRATYYLAIRSA